MQAGDEDDDDDEGVGDADLRPERGGSTSMVSGGGGGAALDGHGGNGAGGDAMGREGLGSNAGAAVVPTTRKAAKKNKKRIHSNAATTGTGGGGNKDSKEDASTSGGGATSRNKKARKQARRAVPQPAVAAEPPGLSPAQQAVNEQMKRALEEDQYSAIGSIVETDSDEEDQLIFHGQPVRLDRTALQTVARKHHLFWRLGVTGATTLDHGQEDDEEDEEGDDAVASTIGENNGKKRGGRNKKRTVRTEEDRVAVSEKDDIEKSAPAPTDPLGLDVADDDLDRDGGSIFGQTTGAANFTWVECDKCKKWRRLRGVVDEKKLPTKWYCTMNKSDPERARCSAPEEEYETQHTPESAADARTRKHLRIWVRRLQCNEAYETRQPTLTRGKKRATSSSSKDPYEWVRCCNPSCGKWRAILKIMDAKANVIDRTKDGEWYCVMNTWDEKTASCAAPQENLPAVGCPPWVMQDE